MIKCICINDKDKPEAIPESHWVKFGQEYTLMMIYPLVQPGAVMGAVLQEIDLEELHTEFSCFAIGRFGFLEEDLPELDKMIQNCQGLQKFNPLKLIEDEILVGRTLTDFDEYLSYEGDDDALDKL